MVSSKNNKALRRRSTTRAFQNDASYLQSASIVGAASQVSIAEICGSVAERCGIRKSTATRRKGATSATGESV